MLPAHSIIVHLSCSLCPCLFRMAFSATVSPPSCLPLVSCTSTSAGKSWQPFWGLLQTTQTWKRREWLCASLPPDAMPFACQIFTQTVMRCMTCVRYAYALPCIEGMYLILFCYTGVHSRVPDIRGGGGRHRQRRQPGLSQLRLMTTGFTFDLMRPDRLRTCQERASHPILFRHTVMYVCLSAAV